MNRTSKVSIFFALGVAAAIMASSTQDLAFDNFFSKLSFDSIYKQPALQSQDQIFSHLIYEYTGHETVPIFIREDQRDVVIENLDFTTALRRSSMSQGDLSLLLGAEHWKTFATTVARSGRQAACIIQYKSEFPYPDGNEWKRLGENSPSEVSLSRGSAYHEIEHCLMPKWQLDYAVDYLIRRFGDPGVKDEKIFRNTYALTLAEIFADVFALSNSPEVDTEGREALMRYRQIMHEHDLDKGVYAYNWGVISSLHEKIPRERLPEDPDLRRVHLLRLSLERLSLPTPTDIKKRFGL
ncbi:hypothetical protein RYA05_05635 [Pseudomonas syringae pv. actinidiae]|nr:hypothetical protein [Pseudomonas syringae pv. actinidiae]